MKEKMKAIRKQIEAGRLRLKAESAAHQAEIERNMRDHQKMLDRFRRECLPHLRTAAPSDYSEWLTGFMLKGGEPAHFYDYTLPISFYLAMDDVALVPLYGAYSASIIVPKGVNVSAPEGYGHHTLYLMDGFEYLNGNVPIYSDIYL